MGFGSSSKMWGARWHRDTPGTSPGGRRGAGGHQQNPSSGSQPGLAAAWGQVDGARAAIIGVFSAPGGSGAVPPSPGLSRNAPRLKSRGAAPGAGAKPPSVGQSPASPRRDQCSCCSARLHPDLCSSPRRCLLNPNLHPETLFHPKIAPRGGRGCRRARPWGWMEPAAAPCGFPNF